MAVSVRRLTIPRTDVTSGAPLSFAQQRLWFLDQFSPDSPTYNISLVVDFEGPLDVEALGAAIREIVRRHEALRTTFPSHRGVPQQLVQPADRFSLPVTDLSGLDTERRDLAVEELVTSEARRPFDLARGPVFRARLLRLEAERHVLVGAVHHIVFDAWSNGIFFRELTTLYGAFSAGEPSPLAEPPVRFVDFAIWQRERLQGEILRRELTYWKAHVGETPRLEWPTDLRRPAAQSDAGAREYLFLPEELISRVDAFSRRESVTLFVTLLAGYAVLLHRFCRQHDFIIGTPIANRTLHELEPVIGFFLNTLPLRLNLEGAPTFRTLLQHVKAVAFAAYAHQELPFEKLVEELRPERSLSHGTIIDTVFVLDNNPGAVGGTVRVGELTLRRRVIDTGTSKFDLGLLLFHRDGGRRATLEYRRDLFEPATAAGLLQQYRRVLDAIVADPDTSIASLPPAPAPEAAILTGYSTADTIPVPREQTIAELFEIEAGRSPAAPALVEGARRLTYDELNRRANQLAHHLRDAGVGEGDRVAIHLERSLDAIVALLAVVKAGAAYLPLDPLHPPQRNTSLAARAGVGTIITRRFVPHAMSLQAVRAVALEEERAAISLCSEQNLGVSRGGASLAYVLFTSGSTGEPKAVGVPHRAIARLAYGMPDVPLGPGARVLQAAPLTFDASTFEIWAPLLRGGSVAIAGDELYTPRELEHLIQEHGITVLWLTASLFNVIIDERPQVLAGVPYVITGGEALSTRHIERALAALPATTLVNGYGPTEAATFSTYFVIPRGGPRRPSVPIGRPLVNTRVYVLDERQRPVASGFPGEIWIGGDGVADGYLGDAELTAERFHLDPFAGAPARIYRTGDLGRVLPDGALEFLGRTDAQIKIRGFRIEPAEIEAALMEHPLVERAAVAAHERATVGRTLVAYVVSCGAAALSPEDLREFLRTRLPEHMVPQYFEPVVALPRLASGKIDRRALAPPDFEQSSAPPRADAAPLTPTETVVADVWKERLRVETIGRNSNFFELGGDSLLAVQVVSRLSGAMDVPLAVRSIFEFPTVAGLAKIIDQHGSAPHEGESDVASGNASTSADERVLAHQQSSPRQPLVVIPGEIEATLAEIWRHILGRGAVDIDDDFFALGGHSLLVLRLASEVESRFGIALPIPLLFQHATIRQQAHLLTERQADPAHTGEWSPLVALQPDGARPPLFLVHAIGGEVLSYSPLVMHLGSDQPVYGLRARTDGGPGCSSVEDMAASYVRAVRRVVPSGPYYLGGYSGGGVIAFEMAQQLRSAGEDVRLLVMIDCPAPGRKRGPWLSRRGLSHLVKNTLYYLVDDDLLRDGFTVARGRLRSRLLRERDRLRKTLQRGTPYEPDIRHALGLWAFTDRSLAFLEVLARALRSYAPKPYSGAITVIRARTRKLGGLTPPTADLGWQRLASGGVQSRMVNGAHDTIIREPRVRMLAQVLTEFLDRARADAG